MRKTTLFAAAVAALALTIGTWFGVRIFTATGASAGPANKTPAMVTGAKGPPTSLYDDYETVVH
jgi:hypothetical protein